MLIGVLLPSIAKILNFLGHDYNAVFVNSILDTSHPNSRQIPINIWKTSTVVNFRNDLFALINTNYVRDTIFLTLHLGRNSFSFTHCLLSSSKRPLFNYIHFRRFFSILKKEVFHFCNTKKTHFRKDFIIQVEMHKCLLIVPCHLFQKFHLSLEIHFYD